MIYGCEDQSSRELKQAEVHTHHLKAKKKSANMCLLQVFVTAIKYLLLHLLGFCFMLYKNRWLAAQDYFTHQYELNKNKTVITRN